MKLPDLPGRYACGALLGAGGSGRVFRVHDSVRDLELALKLVTAAESHWLKREFDTFRQIRHENLIQVFDWGTLPGGNAYYTMELIDGMDWASRMGSPQPPEEVRRILIGILRGIAHLHSHGVIHGDIKPGNVLLGRGDAVKVVDVGMGGSAASAAGSSGTPGYVAPEIWEGAKADLRTDLYSIGVITYEALTGQHPFGGRSVRDVVMGQMEGWVKSLGSHGVRVHADFERAVMRAVERVPGLRQGSADEFMVSLGTEDRIGEIFGGRFCGRDAELMAVEELLGRAGTARETLLTVSGPSGVGKSAFLTEVSHHVVSDGGAAISLSAAQGGAVSSSLSEIAKRFGMTRQGVQEPTISALAEHLWEGSREASSLIWFDSIGDTDAGSIVEAISPLARYVWALSVERKSASRVLFAVTSNDSLVGDEPFARSIKLNPLSEAELAAQVEGVLGTTRLQSEVLHRLHSITGGLPSAINAITTDLVDRKLLDRREGRWEFREIQEIQTIEMPEWDNRWAIAWDHLNVAEQEMLQSLALAEGGISIRAGVRWKRIGEPIETLGSLKARGWVAVAGDRWAVGSEECRRAVLRRSDVERLKCAGLDLLACGDDLVDREDRAALMLAYVASEDALVEGLWAASKLTERGRHRQAAARLEACVRLAGTLRLQSRGQEASLALARTFNQLGRTEEARRCLLDAQTWHNVRSPSEIVGEREFLLGVCERSLSNLESARSHLHRAIEIAGEVAARSLLVRSQAELAEIDWRHGDSAARRGAIEGIREALRSAAVGNSSPDEVASLTYQLGAALILSGEREAAREVLSRGLESPCNDYWKMRLANADSSAAYYLGEFEAALAMTDRAWGLAEQISADHFKPRILSNRAGVLYALGRLHEVVSDDLLAAQWSFRTGNAYDSTTAWNGAAVSLILLGKYEEAIEYARRGEGAAAQFEGRGEQATSICLQANALFHIGDYSQSEKLTRGALALVGDSTLDRSTPRLLWLLGKLLTAKGEEADAQGALQEAERQLNLSKDWEDLPGVQIELSLLRARRGQAELGLRAIREIGSRAKAAAALIVQLYAALAIGEIVVDLGIDDTEAQSILSDALERAERSSIASMSWRVSFYLGEIAARSRDLRGAQSRHRQAINTLREIADRLSPANRSFFLASSHVASAISKLPLRSEPT